MARQIGRETRDTEMVVVEEKETLDLNWDHLAVFAWTNNASRKRKRVVT